jgi:hypothetical protein
MEYRVGCYLTLGRCVRLLLRWLSRVGVQVFGHARFRPQNPTIQGLIVGVTWRDLSCSEKTIPSLAVGAILVDRHSEASIAPLGRGGWGGLGTTGCAAVPLHPWLHPSAPSGPGRGVSESRDCIAGVTEGRGDCKPGAPGMSELPPPPFGHLPRRPPAGEVGFGLPPPSSLRDATSPVGDGGGSG